MREGRLTWLEHLLWLQTKEKQNLVLVGYLVFLTLLKKKILGCLLALEKKSINNSWTTQINCDN